jgi:multidrug transporter EmrE-like cation transporter
MITMFGYFVFQQSLEWRAILGLVMIVGAVILVNTYAPHK